MVKSFMNVRPEVIELTQKWLDRAAGDLKTAQHTLKLSDRECPFETVCFHAQQCAEKSLKAFLTFHGVIFEKTHDLKELLRLSDRIEKLSSKLGKLGRLNSYAVEARYPEAFEEMTRSQADHAVALAQKTYEVIQSRLSAWTHKR